MMASRTGNVSAMKVLLDSGAQVNVKETLRGTTALMWAADQGHAAAIQLLLDHGADTNARSNPAVARRRGAPGKSGDPRRANRTQQGGVPAGQQTDDDAQPAAPVSRQPRCSPQASLPPQPDNHGSSRRLQFDRRCV